MDDDGVTIHSEGEDGFVPETKSKNTAFLSVLFDSDPDTTQRRLEAMERARMKLQEEHDAKAAMYAEQQKQKEEEKRKQKIEEWENLQDGKGYRSKVKPPYRKRFEEEPLLLAPPTSSRGTDTYPCAGIQIQMPPRFFVEGFPNLDLFAFIDEGCNKTGYESESVLRNF
uniref:Selenoprotein S n=1 Tax=Magallana gigas TaxID=29159 RepID=K1QSC8_MAGGI